MYQAAFLENFPHRILILVSLQQLKIHLFTIYLQQNMILKVYCPHSSKRLFNPLEPTPTQIHPSLNPYTAQIRQC